jgi:uncharacterized protein (DUF924 family)
MNMNDSPIQQVLSFWFSEPFSEHYGKPQLFWFNATPEMDLEIGIKFKTLYEKAKSGELRDLQKNEKGTLTLIILLDQIPRHLFRGKKDAFATDVRAVILAKEGILKGFDRALPFFMKPFFYLPLEHSEDLDDQQQSVNLFKALGDEVYLRYALEHYNVIKQFGRFPHRNAALNRINTKEEILFLQHQLTQGVAP